MRILRHRCEKAIHAAALGEMLVDDNIFHQTHALRHAHRRACRRIGRITADDHRARHRRCPRARPRDNGTAMERIKDTAVGLAPTENARQPQLIAARQEYPARGANRTRHLLARRLCPRIGEQHAHLARTEPLEYRAVLLAHLLGKLRRRRQYHDACVYPARKLHERTQNSTLALFFLIPADDQQTARHSTAHDSSSVP